jgi:hypothetical protein
MLTPEVCWRQDFTDTRSRLAPGLCSGRRHPRTGAGVSPGQSHSDLRSRYITKTSPCCSGLHVSNLASTYRKISWRGEAWRCYSFGDENATEVTAAHRPSPAHQTRAVVYTKYRRAAFRRSKRFAVGYFYPTINRNTGSLPMQPYT